MVTADELRQKYLDFFKEKKHAIIPSFPVVPENDPTALFINSGMHPLVPYLMGESHPKGKRLANVQKCIRTVDIDEVGDNRHMTFFEMMGNWSLGDYFKSEAIAWSWEFMTDEKWLGLDPKRIYVTVFAGDKNAGKDEESIEFWKEQFKKANIEASVCELDVKAEKNSRIFLLGACDNWWGPVGETGPCGPCSEIFYDTRPNDGELEGAFDDLVNSFRLMEIWNDVFMEFNKKSDNSFEKLSQHNVDTGMGLERTAAILAGKENAFEIEIFTPLFDKISEISEKEYREEENKVAFRIIADHIRAAVFIVADGIEPSNTERGYVLRCLIRRAVREAHKLGIKRNFTVEVAKIVQEIYQEIYPEVGDKKVHEELKKEEEKFRKTLEKGLREFKKKSVIVQAKTQIIKASAPTPAVSTNIMSGKEAFNLYQTHGFPLEMIKEEAVAKGLKFRKKEEEEFNELLKKHQELSRTASAGMFKGGLADTKEKTTQLHTAAHLMLAGLRKVLGDHVHQKGSNINGERIRFDFSHPDKMTDGQKKAVEDFVNEAINAEASVILEELNLDEARKQGAEGAFENKYGDKVKVYTVKSSAQGELSYSREICGGPHVKNTADIQGIFKIIKEKSSSSGVRRIKAVLE